MSEAICSKQTANENAKNANKHKNHVRGPTIRHQNAIYSLDTI